MTTKPDDEILKVIEQFSSLEKSVLTYGEVTRSAVEVMARQTRMLDLALDVMIAISQDETAEPRIRRRLVFALAQIKGIGMPS